ncbi:GMP synthase (glutamine-hydrolysing) [Sporanaerobacter acetigenes DSM 13106]|uniref:GMP synthase [glutamine-hydrolyzing] n=2 Tax=Sporanaerobacter acetigenes TaxID=165813 RepID=A0A1M5SC35_9FIRM|nr:GMP synthase (glutamine-hydrolysing) [Sporanaerobacter acetigenes DSM 13106]
MILIMDFGGQYSQLIGRRVREASVYCEIVPYNYPIEKIKEKNPEGIIFSGGPASVYGEDSPKCDSEVFNLGIPILGICYGSQLMAQVLDGKVSRATTREYGKTQVNVDNSSLLFSGMDNSITAWMSHTDFIEKAPEGFKVVGNTPICPVAAMESSDKKLYGVQFHPEVEHTKNGRDIIKNFLFKICNCNANWNMEDFINKTVAEIKEEIRDGKAICALSGGVDSSVAAVLVHEAIGDSLTCVFVDHGLLRKDEAKQVVKVFREEFHMNLIAVDARERFLNKLKGVEDPERKRKIIGEEFIRVFEEEQGKLEGIDYLVQGTIYPDVVESGVGKSSVIKSHHNVGGLPEDVNFKLVEPLRQLFKDEVREVGRKLGLSEEVVERQPFPGPGLAIRVLGEVNEDKLKIVREADYIFRDEIKKAGLDREIWQYFALLPNIRSVGVMGDERTYSYTVGLRAVTSIDGMTADWARIPLDVLEKISNRIVNEVEHVNRVVYDITSKPPATIEWE